MLGFVESLLPGTRSLRPVLFAGLLWALMIWLIWGGSVPSSDDADGQLADVYNLAEFLGPIVSGLVLGVGVFVLGAVATPLQNALSQLVGRALRSLATQAAWQRHAQRRRQELISQRKALQNKQREQQKLLADEVDSRKVSSRQSKVDATTAEMERVEHALSVLPEAKRLRGRVIAHTNAVRTAVGDPPVVTERTAEYQLMRSARDHAAEDMLQSAGITITLEDALGWSSQTDLINLTAELQAELEPDALDLLRALDEGLYLEMDRERAEREVRLAISLPLIALGILLAVNTSAWGIALALAAAVLLGRASYLTALETKRVVNLIRIKGLEPPSVRAAAALGRDIIRDYVATTTLRAQKDQEQQDRADGARTLTARTIAGNASSEDSSKTPPNPT